METADQLPPEPERNQVVNIVDPRVIRSAQDRLLERARNNDHLRDGQSISDLVKEANRPSTRVHAE